ncbi:HNH endonuclease [Streptomyces sp. NPDC091268]
MTHGGSDTDGNVQPVCRPCHKSPHGIRD